MRVIYTPVLLGFCCLLGPGCSFVHIIKRNIVHEPALAFDEKIILQRHERLGRLAWDEMVRQYGCQFSDDYRDGFIDGFVDYLTYGGCQGMCGESPVIPGVPPPRYRRAKAMSPAGLRAAEEWFMGVRHGSSTAQASGLRQLVVIPIVDRPVTVGEGPTPGPNELMGSGRGQTNPTLPPPTPKEGEQLPPPRTVPPADAEPKPATPPAPMNPPPPPPLPEPAVPPPPGTPPR